MNRRCHVREVKSPRRVLVLRWVPVRTADGRVRMEARWHLEGSADHPVAA